MSIARFSRPSLWLLGLPGAQARWPRTRERPRTRPSIRCWRSWKNPVRVRSRPRSRKNTRRMQSQTASRQNRPPRQSRALTPSRSQQVDSPQSPPTARKPVPVTCRLRTRTSTRCWRSWARPRTSQPQRSGPGHVHNRASRRAPPSPPPAEGRQRRENQAEGSRTAGQGQGDRRQARGIRRQEA